MEFEIPPLHARNIEIGYGGIILYSLESSIKEQLGYSIGTKGQSLVGFDEETGWKGGM